MVDDEYELTPHKQLEELRHEIELLKKNPMGSKKESKDLLEAMDRLNASVNTLIEMFKLAGDSMKKGKENDEKTVNFDPLMERIDELEKQNKVIAEGMVSLSELVKKAQREIKDRQEAPLPRPPIHPPPLHSPSFDQDDFSGPPPSFAPPIQDPDTIQRLSPRPPRLSQGPPAPMAPPPNPLDAPLPPPNFQDKKKGLFGR